MILLPPSETSRRTSGRSGFGAEAINVPSCNIVHRCTLPAPNIGLDAIDTSILHGGCNGRVQPGVVGLALWHSTSKSADGAVVKAREGLNH